jgi:hypothetical protein
MIPKPSMKIQKRTHRKGRRSAAKMISVRFCRAETGETITVGDWPICLWRAIEKRARELNKSVDQYVQGLIADDTGKVVPA